jgi:hypothetical protein
LRAADIARLKSDGSIVTWDFKPTVGTSIGSQAIANAVVLRAQGLNEPVWFQILGNSLRLEGPAGTEVTASLTHLPGVEPTLSSKRLEHFAMYYDLTPWVNDVRPNLNLPERPTLPDTSYGTICPNGSYTKVP